MMKRVACYHCVSRIARMLVREEPRVNGFDSALAKSRDHRSRHVYRDDPPNIGSDGQRELARARSKIDDGALGTNSHPLELPDVLRPIRLETSGRTRPRTPDRGVRARRERARPAPILVAELTQTRRNPRNASASPLEHLVARASPTPLSTRMDRWRSNGWTTSASSWNRSMQLSRFSPSWASNSKGEPRSTETGQGAS